MAGDVYTYSVRRTWDTTPGDSQVDRTETGSLRVAVHESEPFGVWGRSFPISQVQTLEAASDSIHSWFKLDVSADSSASFTMIGEYTPWSGLQELADPRPVLGYPLITPELGPDSMTTWVEAQAQVTRWAHGLRDLIVAYDVEVYREEICEDNQGNPMICTEEELFESISGEIETYLVEDLWVSPTATAAESTWYGPHGIVRSVLASRSAGETILTTTRLTRLSVDDSVR
ncbi:MAG: hypothetical protein CME06_17340 [Gemmatimonadetes bacterium]|nr:hypothetical protein [Gemmatimonadota bacterium]